MYCGLIMVKLGQTVSLEKPSSLYYSSSKESKCVGLANVCSFLELEMLLLTKFKTTLNTIEDKDYIKKNSVHKIYMGLFKSSKCCNDQDPP